MNKKEPMKLVILEDDEHQVKRFKTSIKARTEFELVLATNSCVEAIRCIKTNDIEGIIVDIELNQGLGGSGLDFLSELNSLHLDQRPAIIVTTQTESDLVYNTARRLNVDMIYCKNKPDYNPTIVLNQFLMFRPSLSTSHKRTHSDSHIHIETETERKKRIENKIIEELNLIGIPANLKGRQYLFDSIFFLIENGHKDDAYYTNFLKDKYKIRNSSINISIQDAINSAWRNTPNEDILEHFTANISYINGTPTPTQFIHYYVDKIKRSI